MFSLRMLLLFLLGLIAVVNSSPLERGENAASQYDDAYARNKVYPLNAATNFVDSKKITDCISKFWSGLQFKRRVSVSCSNGTDVCSAFSGVATGDKTIFLAFQGTDTAYQLLIESEQTAFGEKNTWPIGGLVSKYFSDGFLDIWLGGLKNDFNSMRNAYPSYTVLVTGHSLGGAMASLAASYIVGQKLVDASQVQLITVGQPRTGDIAYAQAVDEKIPFTYRIVHRRDMVPHLPPNGFVEYHHHKNEIWYNNDMSTATYKECDADESINCSNGQTDLSIPDHIDYFNWDYAIKGCPDW